MNEDCLKLTSYFGERQRSENRFVAEALLDLFEQHQAAVSVLLRGIEGFGVKQRLRTDRLLTLSEDLPLVAIAVDERKRIDSLAREVLSLKRAGLVTLERARMLSGTIEPVQLPQDPGEQTKLTVYLGRQERVYRMAAFAAVCDLLHRRGLAGATVLLGVDGTMHGVRERARFFSSNANVPLMVIAVGDGGRIAQVLPELGGLLRSPLVTLERVRVCKRDGNVLGRPPELPDRDASGALLWQKLMVFSSEHAEHEGQAQHRLIVRRLREHGIRGATAVRGFWGFHGDHPPQGDRLLQLRRRVPVVTVVIDAPSRIAAAFDVMDEATPKEGLITSEIVPAATALGAPQPAPGLRLARRLSGVYRTSGLH